MRFEDYIDRVRPVGVLYVDVHPFTVVGDAIQFLVLRRRSDNELLPAEWQTVSGKLLPDERIVDGFNRQVSKKTGLVPERLFKLNSVATFFDEHYDTVMLVPNAVALLPHESIKIDTSLHDAHEWLELDEALERLQWPTQKLAIRAIADAFQVDNGALRLVPGQILVSEIKS